MLFTGDSPGREGLQQAACYRARDENGGLVDLEEKLSSVSLPASLSGILQSILEADGKQY